MDRRLWSCSSTKALCVTCIALSASALKIDTPSVWLSEANNTQEDAGQRSHFGWKSVRMLGQKGAAGRYAYGSQEHVPLYTEGQGYRQTMRNFADAQYVSYFNLGGQITAGIFDTGSFELVVFSKNCSTCGAAAKYDPKLSDTHRTGSMLAGQTYGSGQTFSKDASDFLSIGPYRVNQTFWEVTRAKMPVLQFSEFQCILGLGPPQTPTMDAWEKARKAAHNVSEVMSTQGAIDEVTLRKAQESAKIAVAVGKRHPVLQNVNESMFSVCIGKDPGSDGVFVWNDSSAVQHPELFHKVPVIGSHSWSVEANNARLSWVVNLAENASTDLQADGEENVFNKSTSISLGCEDGCGFLLDSGTTMLTLPHTVINRLVQIISSSSINCSNMLELPHLVFEMNGKTLSLPPDAFISEVTMAVPTYLQSFVRVRNLGTEVRQPGRRCELVAMESYAKTEAGPLWIFGMPFFRKYYTSFALAKNSSGRAIYLAGASEQCTPVKRRVEVHDGPDDMWKRFMDPQQLWVPLSVQLAATEDYVRL